MQIEEALEQMYISEILAEIAKRLNIVIGTSSTFNFRYNEYILNSPIIKPKLFNHATYTFLVPFTFTAKGGDLYLIDFSKIQNELESTIKSYYFSANITARDVTIGLFAKLNERVQQDLLLISRIYYTIIMKTKDIEKLRNIHKISYLTFSEYRTINHSQKVIAP